MLRAACLLLTVLTGASALVYEVAWQKYLATLLGSHAEATAAVLAIFLGGLAAGYELFARLAARAMARGPEAHAAHLLRLYGVVELSIGIYALLFPILFGVAQIVSLAVPRGHPALAFAFDVALSALLIGPPAVAMGGTIPLLTQALAGDVALATRVHAWVYGCNTLGAVAGALLGGIALVPWLGLDGTLRATSLVNLFAGLGFVRLARRARDIDTPAPAAAPALPQPLPRFTAYAAVALLSGFAMMTLQTLFNRIGALALGASPFTFAEVVAIFVLCIALGSLVVSALPRIPPGLVYGSAWLLVALLVCLYPLVPDSVYWAHALRALFRTIDQAFWPYQLAVFLAGFAVLAIPIGISGALLPLLFHQLRRELADLGATAGRLYAWNTLGSLLGALVGGYLLLVWLDLHHVYRVALGCLVVAAMILTLRVQQKRPRLFDALALAGMLGLIAWLPAWDASQLTAGAFRLHEPMEWSFAGPRAFFASRQLGKLVFHDDDPTSTVTVLEPDQSKDSRPNRSIIVNGKSDGSLIGDYTTMGLLGLVPALLSERAPERCFVIGWGTGVSTGELGALDETREIEVAEISQAVLDAAPLFASGNQGASSNPKVRAIHSDAYRALRQSGERFDVIVSEPSNPWVTGVEMLYSVEFLEAVRDHLAPGGIYAQWFHLYETDPDVVDLVLRTFAHVFPDMSVWFTQYTDLMLIGRPAGSKPFDLARLEARLARPDFQRGFERVGIDRLGALLAHELIPSGVVAASGLGGELHTLRRPLLSERAARAFFIGETARLPKYALPESARVGAENSLVRRYFALHGNPESLLDDVTRETCGLGRRGECAALFAAWRREHPGSSLLSSALADFRRAYTGDGVLFDPNLDRIAALFDGAQPAPAATPDERPLARAQRVSSDYVTYYHHAMPFDRRALSQVWGLCTNPACREPRRQVEAELGALGPAS
jgi:predicted membrane-bound spermidine synthase